MKQLRLLLLFLLPLWASAQVSTGQEQFFDYGIQVEPTALQSISTPAYYGCVGIDGTFGRTPAANVTPTSRTLNINGVSQDLSANRTYRTAQADTGVLTFAGLTTNSATTINVGAFVGVVVDNETDPLIPTYIDVNYAGATGVTVTTIGSGQASYVMASSAGVISFQTTFPTSAERKAKIWLGKVSHPAGAVTLVINEPDYITSPLAFSRDWFQDIGPFVNNGVYPSPNGANLNVNVSAGTITGDGINFVTNRADPNHTPMGPNVAATFSYRTQIGGVTAGVTSVSPGFYDVAGTVTAIPGSSNQATIQYWYAIPGLGYVVQYGQNLYATFGLAVQALGKEAPAFIEWSNLTGNAISISALVVTKGCTNLSDLSTAQFFKASKNGSFFGATSGASTSTMQSTYNNSLAPQITTSNALGAVTIRNGQSLDTATNLQTQNVSGATTWSVDGNGKTIGTSFVDSNSIPTDALLAGGTTLSNPLSGFGTVSVVPKFTSTSTVGNSNIFDNAGLIGVNTTSPLAALQVKSGINKDMQLGTATSNYTNSTIFTDFTSLINSINFSRSSDGSFSETLFNYNGTNGLSNLGLAARGGIKFNVGGVADTGFRIKNTGISDFSGFVGIKTGNTTPVAPLHIGSGTNFALSNDPGVLISRDISDATGVGSAHGFVDEPIITRNDINSGYATFDARTLYSGTNSWNHWVGLQSFPIYQSTGTIENMYGVYHALKADSGQVVNSYGAKFINPLGTGSVLNNYGLYVDSMTRGSSSNYAIFTAGTTPSSFGGSVLIGTTTDNGEDKLQVNGTASGSPATLSNQFVIKSQLDAKADLASPALTGVPTAPTATAGTNTTQVATTAFVQSNTRPYKAYTVSMTQTGTSNPSVTLTFENGLSGAITWTRVGVGDYRGTLASAFTVNKTVSFTAFNGNVPATPLWIFGERISNDEIRISTYSGSTATDGLMTGATIEFRVYN